MDADHHSLEIAAEPKAIPCPFVGARPFESQDSAFFFGRDRDARDLADMVAACTLTVVYGPSGAGKSSLLNARLPEMLESIEPDWIIISFSRWQRRFEPVLLNEVDTALRGIVGSPPVDAPVAVLAQRLFNAARETGRPIALVLDQFEEYFLYNGTGSADFELSLGRLTNRRNGSVRVILSLRSDRLFLLDRLRGRMPEVLQNLFLVDALDEVEARDAVLKPVEVYNRQHCTVVKVADEVVEAVVQGSDEGEIFHRLPFRGRGVARAAAASEAGQAGSRRPRLRVVAPFLQLALESLWRHDVEILGRSTLTLQGLRKLADAADEAAVPTLIGRLAQRHLDTILSQRSEEEQNVCALLFDRMVTNGGLKVAVTLPDDFLRLLNEQQLTLAARVLDDLAAPGPSRLVRPVAPNDNLATETAFKSFSQYEIVHDALAVPILDWVVRWRERMAKVKADAEAVEREAEVRADAHRKAAATRLRLRLVCAFLCLAIATALIGLSISEVQGRRSAVKRFTTFAAKDTAPEFRLRLLLAVAALSRASGPWSYLVSTVQTTRVLRDTLLRSPVYGGSALAAGFDETGSQLAWLTSAQGLSVISLTDGSRRDIATPGQLRDFLNSSSFSRSEKLRQFPATLTGFLSRLQIPAIIRAGMLFYRPNGEPSAWVAVDLADLIPDSFEQVPGALRADITAGAVQISALNFGREMQVVRLRPKMADDGRVTFERIDKPPPLIKWPTQRFQPALSPRLGDGDDRFAFLQEDPANPKPGQMTSLTLKIGNISHPDSMVTPWHSTPQLTDERIQRIFDSSGATTQPSMAFSDDHQSIVVRIADEITIIPLPADTPANEAGTTPPVTIMAPKNLGNEVVPGLWNSRPLIAAARMTAATAAESTWRVVWLTSGGLATLTSSGNTGHVEVDPPLLTGMDTAAVSRLNLSPDGRFALALSRYGSDWTEQQVRVWDSSQQWRNKVNKADINELASIACATAAREHPNGALFSPDEKIVWIGSDGSQPCEAIK